MKEASRLVAERLSDGAGEPGLLPPRPLGAGVTGRDSISCEVKWKPCSAGFGHEALRGPSFGCRALTIESRLRGAMLTGMPAAASQTQLPDAVGRLRHT